MYKISIFLAGLNFLLLSKVHAMKKEDWCQKTHEDLDYILQDFKENFVAFSLDKLILEASEKRVKDLKVEPCQSLIDYRKVLSKFFAGFHDIHVDALWNHSFTDQTLNEHLIDVKHLQKFDFSMMTLGFKIKKLNQQYFVTDILENHSEAEKLHKNDELLKCENSTPSEIIERELLPYEGYSVKKIEEARLANKISNRWDKVLGDQYSCEFSRDGKVFKLDFKWKKLSKDLSSNKSKHKQPIYESKKIDIGQYIRLSQMGGDDQLMKQFLSEAIKLRQAKIILLDLRNNPGGSSIYGTDWIKNLYGYTPIISEVRSLYLASVKNLKHWEHFYNLELKNNDNNQRKKIFANIINCLKKNIGKLVECEEEENPKLNSVNNKSQFQGKIYVLINGGIASSAEIFVQELKLMPNVTLIGQTTNASSASGNIFLNVTPNGLIYSVPTTHIGGLFVNRMQNQPFEPDVALEFDIKKELNGEDSLLSQTVEYIKKSIKP